MSHKAHAPYNFVPLNDQVLPGKRVDHDSYYTDKNTGYFDVEMTTVTPLFVRGMRGADMLHDTKISEPFMLNDKPVIPGSSLRGMIRAIVEIITFGKMHFVDDAQKIFFRAVAAENEDPLKKPYTDIMGELNSRTHAGNKVKAGYLRKKGDSWAIQPAPTFGSNSFTIIKRDVIRGVDDFRDFDDADYQVTTFDVCYNENKDKKITVVRSPQPHEPATATLICTGNMKETNEDGTSERKYFALVRKSLPGGASLIPDTVIEDYKKGLSPFQKDNERNPYFDKEWGFLREGRVVFYVLDDAVVDDKGKKVIRSIGHTPNFRVAHLNSENRATSPRDFVPNKLLDPYFTDYADAMFGYVSDEGFEPTQQRPVAYSGRISFTNASLADGQTDFTPRKTIIRILGTPKPTTFQHYLEQQPHGVNTPKSELTHYGKKGARIRGHKLYWHKHITLNKLPETEIGYKERPNVDVHMKPLHEGLTFIFRVYFENLTDAELGALAWALSLDDMPNGNRHHMLGMAKPYGLGVVKLTPTLYLSDRQTRYWTLFDADGKWYEARGDEITNFSEYITAFKTILKDKIGVNFDGDERIQEFFEMLKLHDPDDYDEKTFIYMTIGDKKTNVENEYEKRPVLQRPHQVLADNKKEGK